MTSLPSAPAADAPAGAATSRRGPAAAPALAGVGTAVPPHSYSQRDILDLYGIEDARLRSLFLNSAIERRHLTLAPPSETGGPRFESQGDLLRKHTEQGVRMGAEAVRSALASAGIEPSEIGHLTCVSTTGLLTPGLSALLIKEMGLRTDTSRLDVVGMGCNAGLNALNAVAGWSAGNPGRPAVLLCAEVCSAAYVFDGTMRTAVVNSLFGDGAAAAVLVTGGEARPGPRVLKFASRIIPEASGAMRYDWDDDAGKFSFYLDRDVPYVVGAHAEQVVDSLLSGTGLRRSDIAHWVVHSGGKKVIDSVRVNLGLTRFDLRHTSSVLRDYGNLSSGSFLFSYRRLLDEKRIRPGENAVFMTMGPGSTIETALLEC